MSDSNRIEEKLSVIEDKVDSSLQHIQLILNQINSLVIDEINPRTLTLEWHANNQGLELNYLRETLDSVVHKIEVESPKVKQYLNQYPQYSIETVKNIAVDSPDHIEPDSTYEGIVRKPLFVKACEKLIDKDRLNFLDIGCGAGGLVFDFIKRGHFAVGLDGSDACKQKDVGYWNYLKHLHTCDVSETYKILDESNKRIQFDIVSMWEVFEHIQEEKCNSVLKNIHDHLSADGLFVGSISQQEYVNQESGICYHVTLKSKSWWYEKFKKNKFKIVESQFKFVEYCRGVGDSYQDLHNYDKEPHLGFHFVLQKL